MSVAAQLAFWALWLSPYLRKLRQAAVRAALASGPGSIGQIYARVPPQERRALLLGRESLAPLLREMSNRGLVVSSVKTGPAPGGRPESSYALAALRSGVPA